MLHFLIDHTILILAILCFPVLFFVSFYFRRDTGLKGVKLVFFPFVYAFFVVLSISILSIPQNMMIGSSWSFHHQGIIIVLPFFSPIFAAYLKCNRFHAADYLSVPVPVLYAIFRCFCLVKGCCYSKYIVGTYMRWPIREFIIAINILIFVYYLIVFRKKHTEGILFPVYMIIYGFQIIFELLFRADSGWLSNRWHLFYAIVALVIGFFFLFYAYERNQKKAMNSCHKL